MVSIVPVVPYQSYILSVNDALDEILEDSDDESEEQAVIDKVLDEIGIEISGKVKYIMSNVYILTMYGL